MKPILTMFAFAFLLCSCDDGDLTFESINFDSVATQRCGNKLYKLNEKEALIVNIGEQVSEFDNFFSENPTGTGIPQTIDILSGNPDIMVAYRLYDGDVTSASICNALPPIHPAAVEDWNATSGTMQITTTANIVENTTIGFEGGQKITGYKHNIVLNNIEFNKSDGTTQLYQTFPFGTFDKSISYALPTIFDEELEKCSDSNEVFNIAGLHAMVLQIDPALIDGSTLDTPQTATVSATSNAFTYEIFAQGPLSAATHFCTSTPESNPIQVWQGTGEIEVTSTQVGSGLQHTIILRNIVLTRGNAQFILATEYHFGTLFTSN